MPVLCTGEYTSMKPKSLVPSFLLSLDHHMNNFTFFKCSIYVHISRKRALSGASVPHSDPDLLFPRLIW